MSRWISHFIAGSLLVMLLLKRTKPNAGRQLHTRQAIRRSHDRVRTVQRHRVHPVPPPRPQRSLAAPTAVESLTQSLSGSATEPQSPGVARAAHNVSGPVPTAADGEYLSSGGGEEIYESGDGGAFCDSPGGGIVGGMCGDTCVQPMLWGGAGASIGGPAGWNCRPW